MPRKKDSFINSKIPLYYQLENILREKIVSGHFESGTRIPTELDLIKQYNVSRITVRQALQTLAEEGLIERRQGSGTYVSERKSAKRKFSETIHLTSSLDELMALGVDSQIKVLEMNLVEADEHEAEVLQLKTGTPIYRLKRLRFHDNKPFGLLINYLPKEIAAKLTPSELSGGALLQTIENKLGIQLDYARQEIKAELSDSYLAEILEVRAGTPLLSFERTVFSEKGTPVEFVYSLYRSDLYGYSMKFQRDNLKD